MKKMVIVDAVLYRKLRHRAIDYDVTVSHLIDAFLEMSLNAEMPKEMLRHKAAENRNSPERQLLLQYYLIPPIPDTNSEFLTTTQILEHLETSSGYKPSLRKLGLELRAMKFERTVRQKGGIRGYGYIMSKKTNNEEQKPEADTI